ncbi:MULTISPECIES: DUF3870 domain-containing protein [unclassified Bacillus (in: firmicutes)]|uniref:DUF3870 domain-containing protein n=1 Tax=unclassified Bacillus (in: firmicutes) TaxID=185979 RepID=UPI0008E6B461|nr:MULTISPECIES: DUF3870 domain-containing protein [unclassified Bacillus (in: firmicutes)]SFA69668.1 protein of unknown function [Bacillus sp. UNCCL13]SFQ58992.1 protein of unknown function [Bacillus sp. cl95]
MGGINIHTLDTVIVTGYAKAPQGTSMYELYKHAGIVLEIDYKTHTIEKADFTFVTGLTKDFFERILIGYRLDEGLEPLIQTIKEHYFAPSQQAIIVALQSAVQRYWDSTANRRI